MLFPSGNPFKCHEEVLYLQPLIPPKRSDNFSTLTGGCSEGLGALSFFFERARYHALHELLGFPVSFEELVKRKKKSGAPCMPYFGTVKALS